MSEKTYDARVWHKGLEVEYCFQIVASSDIRARVGLRELFPDKLLVNRVLVVSVVDDARMALGALHGPRTDWPPL